MASAVKTVLIPRRLLLGVSLGIVALGIVAAGVLLRPGLVEYRIWQARRALARHDARTALSRLDLAESLNPKSGAIQFWMARAHRRLGQMDRAHERLARASRLGYSAEALDLEAMLALAQAGRMPLSDPRLLARMMNPGDDAPELYEAAVQGSLRSFRLDDARSLLDAWEGDQADSPQPHMYRGLVLSHQGAWPEAADSFGRALALAPWRNDVRLHLARALRESRDYRRAVGLYRQYLVGEADDPDALFGLGMCLDSLGKSQEARETYVRVLTLKPDHDEARLAIGKLDSTHGRAAEAIAWLEPAVARSPHEQDLRLAYAWALQIVGRPAREHFEFAARAQAASATVKHLVRRVVDNPRDVELRYAIGAMLLQYGRPQEGVVWLESVLQIQPDHQRARDALAAHEAGRAVPKRDAPAPPRTAH